MKPDDATLVDWQELVDEYRTKENPIYPIAMRMENSQLSTARHFGGYTMNGHTYIVVYPWKSMRIHDGKALLGVEAKFHLWACKKLKNKNKMLIKGTEQGELGL